jgi:hypothetical protein
MTMKFGLVVAVLGAAALSAVRPVTSASPILAQGDEELIFISDVPETGVDALLFEEFLAEHSRGLKVKWYSTSQPPASADALPHVPFLTSINLRTKDCILLGLNKAAPQHLLLFSWSMHLHLHSCLNTLPAFL